MSGHVSARPGLSRTGEVGVDGRDEAVRAGIGMAVRVGAERGGAGLGRAVHGAACQGSHGWAMRGLERRSGQRPGTARSGS